MDNMDFDYYYGDESNQFSFYRIPRQLITGSDAKLLYGLLLDRMGLSRMTGMTTPGVCLSTTPWTRYRRT